MKKLIALSFIVLGTGALAQSESEKTVERLKIYRTEKGTSSEEVKKEEKVMTPEEEIEYCEGVILALDQKEEAIRSNPEEFKRATEEGWFKSANETRVAMRNRINELKNK